MKSIESSAPRRRIVKWLWAAWFTACLALAPVQAATARATAVAADPPAIESVEVSAAPEPVDADATRRSAWRAMMCGIARFISKIDPGFGESAQMICEFIESLDGN